ncbi:MAG: hypothetical protein KZQ92_09465 [Candidatus Thiodiazotropha sp. (ex Lucinoma borealis)]|nr:hypothetical protein [Candidatus Thiodiazotropha sp. (ex Lucinoma borealis)]
MSIPPELDQASKDLVSRFFEEYGIRTINITQGEDIRKDEVCHVEMIFAADSDSDGKEYVVSFKLTGDVIDLHHHISSIDCPANPVLVLTTEGEKLATEDVKELLRHFLNAIGPRVAKIHKEQSILATRPLGKTFILHNKTRFKVLTDDGEGHLTIGIIDGEIVREAKLSANDLLDGLYVGMIAPA